MKLFSLILILSLCSSAVWCATSHAGAYRDSLSRDWSLNWSKTDDFERAPLKMLWIPINREATTKYLKTQFGADLGVFSPPVNPHAKGPNPFGISDKDFDTDDYLVTNGETPGHVPLIQDSDAKWFQDEVSIGNYPDLFEIGGHHVISEGWHSDREDKFLFAPTLLETLELYPAAKAMFEHVKLAILWGCNTMTNLEPHGEDGEFLDGNEIKKIYSSGPKGRERMIGSDDVVNSLEFYKSRLAREYGPHSRSYEYTRDAKKEKCRGPGKYDDCVVTNLERIMPESFLWNEDHPYNEPMKDKKMFPNAYLILGFSSASPSEETRAGLLSVAVSRAKKALNGSKKPSDVGYIDNVLKTIVADSTVTQTRKRVIEALRREWTLVTYEKNRQRPSGSITPAFPDLDANGVFNVDPVHPSRSAPVAPYEPR